MILNDLSQELYRRLLDNEDPPPNLSAAAAAASALATKRKLVLALRGQGRLREAALAEAVAIGCCTKCGQVLHIDSFKYKDVQRIIIIVTRCHKNPSVLSSGRGALSRSWRKGCRSQSFGHDSGGDQKGWLVLNAGWL